MNYLIGQKYSITTASSNHWSIIFDEILFTTDSSGNLDRIKHQDTFQGSRDFVIRSERTQKRGFLRNWSINYEAEF